MFVKNVGGIVKTNFPEISFPPPGGNKFPGGVQKINPRCSNIPIFDALGQSIIGKIFVKNFGGLVKANFPEISKNGG